MPLFTRTRPALVVSLDDAHRAPRPELTGLRGAELASARALGLNVPPAWFIPAPVFRETVRAGLPPGHDPTALTRVIHRPLGARQAAAAREQLASIELPDELVEDLAALLQRVEPLSRRGLALRSSPTCPDASVARAAGLLHSELGIDSLEALLDGVRRCWASLFAEGTLTYLRERRLRDVAMAVLLQPVVDSTLAGTLLSRVDDDTSPRESTAPSSRAPRPVRVAVAARGLRPLVKDGAAELDTVHFDADGRVLACSWAPSPGAAGLGPDADVAPAHAAASWRAAVDELGRLGERLPPTRHEVDFALHRSGELFVLGLRQSSGQGYPLGGRAETLWRRVDVAQAGPGPTSVLSSDLSLRRAQLTLANAAAPAEPGGARPELSLAMVTGRSYLAMTEPERRRGAAPTDPSALDELLGGQAYATPEAAPRVVEEVSLPRLGLLAARLATDTLRLADTVEHHDADAGQQRRWLAELDLAILPDDSLQTTLDEGRHHHDRTTALLAECTAALTTCRDLLGALLARSGGLAVSTRLEVVLGACGEVVSALPAIAFGHVAAIARRDAPARAALESALRGAEGPLPEGPSRQALEQWLEAYGDHCLGESELGRARWREQPRTLLQVLATVTRGEPPDVTARAQRAASTAARETTRLEQTLPFLDARLARELMARYRTLVRLRERVRVRLSHALAMLRTIVLDADRRLQRCDPGIAPGSAFDCSYTQLVQAMREGRAELRAIAASHRIDLAHELASVSAPGRFRGVLPHVVPAPRKSATLRGVGVSTGVAIGRLWRAGSTSLPAGQFCPGDLLLVASPEPALAPLLALCGGVVCELGTPLAHGAVVARELGVPMVVAVVGSRQSLRDGERVRVDGGAGIVERFPP